MTINLEAYRTHIEILTWISILISITEIEDGIEWRKILIFDASSCRRFDGCADNALGSRYKQ